MPSPQPYAEGGNLWGFVAWWHPPSSVVVNANIRPQKNTTSMATAVPEKNDNYNRKLRRGMRPVTTAATTFGFRFCTDSNFRTAFDIINKHTHTPAYTHMSDLGADKIILWPDCA